MFDLAHAQEQSTAKGTDLVSLIPLILIAVIFYFFLIRPQQRKEKQRQAMIAALARGDRVVTNGGIIGTVYRVSKDLDIVLELTEGVQVSVRKNAIVEVLAKIGVPSEEATPDEIEQKKTTSLRTRIKKSAKKSK
ncbi:MAG: preprotein translocase subunit YajC [Holosporales bacterium]|jgi:preprotein translocase subunit YajC|nr:preprotein translocase subunit YajC [Holosporales bacterium]